MGISRDDIVRIRVLQNATRMLVNSKELMKQLDDIGKVLADFFQNVIKISDLLATLDSTQAF